MGKHKPKKKTRRDVAEIALSVGEKLAGKPAQVEQAAQEPDARNPAAVALSKLGASKGGKARAKSLTIKSRKEIARKAAKARWAR